MPGFLRSTLLASVLAPALVLPAFAQPVLTVTPNDGLMDAPFAIRLEGAPPGATITISTKRSDRDGRVWTAEGVYQADLTGIIDATVAPSLAGTYQGVAPHGLWCSALPVPVADIPAYLAGVGTDPAVTTTPRLADDGIVHVTLTASAGSVRLAEAHATRRLARDIVREEVDTPGVKGMYFAPRGKPTGVPMVVIGGSSGGIDTTMASRWASHGHPVLAFAYFAYKDLPAALKDIPIETFRDAAKWLKARTGVSRVAILGTSRGSEAAQLAAIHFPDDYRAVIAMVPSHLPHDAYGYEVPLGLTGWTFGGKPIAPVLFSKADTAAFDTAYARDGKSFPGFVEAPYYLRTWTDDAIARDRGFAVETIRGPILAIGGGADAMWPSALGAQQIGRRMAAHGRAADAEIIVYPAVGHSIGTPGVGSLITGSRWHALGRYRAVIGGLPNAVCEAGYDAAERTRVFLRDRVPPE